MAPVSAATGVARLDALLEQTTPLIVQAAALQASDDPADVVASITTLALEAAYKGLRMGVQLGLAIGTLDSEASDLMLAVIVTEWANEEAALIPRRVAAKVMEAYLAE